MYRHLNLSQVESIGAQDYGVLRKLKENILADNKKELNSIYTLTK
jgi:hypothetical protein